jgi:ATP-binding cassette subfamily B multidrug efflux pump
MRDVRVALFAHLQSLSMAYFEARSVGEVLTGLTSDIDSLNQLLTVGGPVLVFDLATIISTAVAILALDWRLGCLILLVVPLAAWATTSIRRGIRSALRIGRTHLAALNGLLAESIAGMRVIELFNRQAAFYTRFERANRDMLSAYVGELRYSSWFGPMIGGSSALAAAASSGTAGQHLQHRSASADRVRADLRDARCAAHGARAGRASVPSARSGTDRTARRVVRLRARKLGTQGRFVVHRAG